MATIQVKTITHGLLDYAKEGREAVGKIKKAVRRVLNVGRKSARQQISNEFQVRTGFLRRQARKMQTRVSVKASEIKGQVAPIPRLMNIFEKGATLSQGRGFLRPRPVVAPAGRDMETMAPRELNQVLREVGK